MSVYACVYVSACVHACVLYVRVCFVRVHVCVFVCVCACVRCWRVASWVLEVVCGVLEDYVC